MSLNQDFEEEYQRGYEAGRRAALAEFHTEWGVDADWGTNAVSSPSGYRTDHMQVTSMVANLREAGHEAHVVWRGVTDWHKEES